MKVWKCDACGIEDSCILFDKSFSDGCYRLQQMHGLKIACPFSKYISHGPNWKETTAYEITERKPDYAGMAKRRQFGKFSADKETWYGYLIGYKKGDEYPYKGNDYMTGTCISAQAKTFTPCTEPVELDPLTMEPK